MDSNVRAGSIPVLGTIINQNYTKMTLLTPRQYVKRKAYKAERMSRIRQEVSNWMNEYEGAHTTKHREVCMGMIQRYLKQYEWYKTH